MPKQRINILLIDDDSADCRLVELTLLKASSQMIDFAIETADTLSEGLLRIDKAEFDLVLLDLGLPDSCGLETLHKMLQSYPDLPFVVLTGLADEQVGIEAIRNGAQDYLVKGQSLEYTLAHTIRYAIERRRIQDHLQTAMHAAEAANTAKSQFLANMSHEIRTPMNAIIGFSDLLAEEQLTQDQKIYVNMIRDSSGSLLELINDILDFSKIEAGKLDIEIIDYSLDQVLTAVDSLIGPSAEQKSLDFQIRKENTLPKEIRTDPARLKQCLINLASNAVKFTENGHVYISVGLQKLNDKQCIRFDVEDTGIGIPSDKHHAIFESFTQLDGSTSRKFGGTGLGLAITNQLAQLLGGKLTLKSQPDKGSTFSLTIPTNPKLASQPTLNTTPLAGTKA